MSKTTDVLVIGSGLAGLTAALAAAGSGCKTSVLCEGMGNLSISGSCIDFLGYDTDGNYLNDPWQGLANLPKEHPYSLLGKEFLQKIFDKFAGVMKEQGMEFRTAQNSSREPVNIRIPTIMGTLKPTYLFPADFDPQILENSHKILVIGISGFRDCKPRLIIEQLRRYPGWEEKEYSSLVLPPPFKEKGRSLNALDIARATDRIHGREWLLASIAGRGRDFDIALLPPILGARPTSSVKEEAAQTLGCPVIEMQCLPPAVAGMRLRAALMDKLYSLGVSFYENAQVTGANIQNGKCEGVKVDATGREVIHQAKSYVIATGGIIGGGIILGEGTAKEAIFGLALPVPPNVDDWSEPEIFGSHFITGMGVPVNSEMRPLIPIDGKNLENVFFAGRTIGGYDYASEKSGHGVALATGWKAGEMAAATAGCAKDEDAAKGEAQ